MDIIQKYFGKMAIKIINSKSRFLCVLQLVASIVFISFGVVASFCCAIVDGVFAARHIVSSLFVRYFKKELFGCIFCFPIILCLFECTVIPQDLRPVYAGRCEYYSSVTAFDLDVSLFFTL